MIHDDEHPGHTASHTAHTLSELQLHGHHDLFGPDHDRPAPDDAMLAGAVADIVDALVSTFADSCLEPDLEEMLWSTVNMFHRATARLDRQLDDNEQAQHRLQHEQDGSEVKSVELERLLTQGETLILRRDAIELMRDQAADRFEHQTGSAWRPRTGSMVNRKVLTAAMIDSRDFIMARKRADAVTLLPAGPKVALTGGMDFNDHALIWDTLDKVHAKHPHMVLLHGGGTRGAELIAARWADNRKVTQIAFRPDWTRHGKAAPFRRNDQMLDLLPIGALVFLGNGIQQNFRDKARKLGIPVWTCGASGA